jgi:hypothetical protein
MKINPIELWTIISILGVGGMIYSAKKYSDHKDNKNHNKDYDKDYDKDHSKNDVERNAENADLFDFETATNKKDKKVVKSADDALKYAEYALKSAEEAHTSFMKTFKSLKREDLTKEEIDNYKKTNDDLMEELQNAQTNLNDLKKLRVHYGGRANKKTKKIKLKI